MGKEAFHLGIRIRILLDRPRTEERAFQINKIAWTERLEVEVVEWSKKLGWKGLRERS